MELLGEEREGYHMVLSDKHILEALELGNRLHGPGEPAEASTIRSEWILIDPHPNRDQLGSCSVDLRLGHEFAVFKHGSVPYVDVRRIDSQDFMAKVRVRQSKPFIMQPKEFVLATTVEHVALAHNILARLEGRSSLGRLGIIVHATAGVVDPGWYGRIVLELANHGVMPVALYPGMRICSLTFERVSSVVDVPYGKKSGQKYAGQSTPVASRISNDPDIARIVQPYLPGMRCPGLPLVQEGKGASEDD